MNGCCCDESHSLLPSSRRKIMVFNHAVRINPYENFDYRLAPKPVEELLCSVGWGGGRVVSLGSSWSVCDLSSCVLISFEDLTLSMIRTMAHLISTPSKFRFDAA